MNIPEYFVQERAYTRNELSSLVEKGGMEVRALDGFYHAYGIFRLRAYWRPFGLIGGAFNRISKVLDALTGRAFSRYFGFEIFVVAKKK